MTVDEMPVSPKLFDMIELLGKDVVGKIVAEWGGVRLYIPHRYRADHPLVQKLGEQASRTLMQYYCGETLSIPRKLFASTKKAQIIEALLAGKPHRVVAREVEVSQRYVEKISMLIRDIK